MDLLVDAGALARRPQTRSTVKLLELAIEGALGFPVSIRGIQLWASPILFEPDRIPERYVTLNPDLERLSEGEGPLRILGRPESPRSAPQGKLWPPLKEYHRRKSP